MTKAYAVFKPTNVHKKVICHGDFLSNNLMFDNKDPNHCIFVDFQLIRYAPLVHDVIQLIYLNTYGNVTEELKIELLEHYHNSLQEIISNNRFTGAIIPSSKEILEGFNEYEYYGKVSLIIFLRPLLKALFVLKKAPSDDEIFHFIDTNKKFKNQIKIFINNILSVE